MKRIIYIALLFFIIGDAVFSFLQFYHTPLDGDMAESVLPMVHMEPLFEHPLGLRVFADPTPYHNPNRYFSHRIFHDYFNLLPSLLRNITSPINSVYLSTAILKFLVHILLIFLISYLIVGKGKLWSFNNVLSIAIITPLFQTNGYRGYLGVVDTAPSYVFFYGLPTLFILIYFTPWILMWKEGIKLSFGWTQFIALTLFAFIVSLSGPLNAGIVGVVFSLYLVHTIYKFSNKLEEHRGWQKSIFAYFKYYKFELILLLPITLLSVYSLYVGSFNSYTVGSQIPLKTMYGKLPFGFFYIFTQKLAWPLLAFAILSNIFIIFRQFRIGEGKKITKTFLWILAFCCLYISLLPLGGYRAYRPFIIRYDTIMPITMMMIFIFGWSSVYISNQLKGTFRIVYIVGLAAILFAFTIADKAQFKKNDCERAALEYLSKVDEKYVTLSSDCTVVTWDLIKDDKQSINLSDLLNRWRIITETKQIRQ